MICIASLLGYKVGRFTYDWALPSILIWCSLEIQQHLSVYVDKRSWRRLLIAVCAMTVCFVSFTSDVGKRWTTNLRDAAPELDHPESIAADKEWFPGDGGIVYSADMKVYYGMFYANPHGNWRYILGHEQKLMPQDDVDILHEILWSSYATKFHRPWVEKMTMDDRLVFRYSKEDLPTKIPELEWKQLAPSQWWVGRTPRDKK